MFSFQELQCISFMTCAYQCTIAEKYMQFECLHFHVKNALYFIHESFYCDFPLVLRMQECHKRLKMVIAL